MTELEKKISLAGKYCESMKANVSSFDQQFACNTEIALLLADLTMRIQALELR
jgi:hypothetical protein